MYKEGQYYLFYSSSRVQLTSYYVGVARASSVLGPYTKSSVPVMQNNWDRYIKGQNTSFEGPGHGSVVADSAGVWWMLYAGWKYGYRNSFPPGRIMLLDRITWTGATSNDIWPYIGFPSDTPQM